MNHEKHQALIDELMKYTELLKNRDAEIYKAFQDGMRQRSISTITGLSISRVKAICAEQRKKELALSVKV